MSTADFPVLKTSRSQIDTLLAQNDWRHLRPILLAVRNRGIGLAMVLSASGPVDLCRMFARPTVIIIGDDAELAVGPDGFDPLVLQTAFLAASLVIQIAGFPDPAHYRRAARFAANKRRHVVVVETRPECAAAWAELAGRYTVAGET